MAFSGSSLADGQVASSAADIYSVPSGKTAIIRTLHVYNTNTTSETVKVYIKRKGSSNRQVGIAVLAQDESAQFFTEPLTLSSEDAIQAETTTASQVDYVVTGAIE